MKQFILKLFVSLFTITIVGTSHAAATDISQLPLRAQSAVKPNVMMLIDDSGSMDSEVAFSTYQGWAYFDWGCTRSFVTPAAVPLDYTTCGSKTDTFIYLFPNGSNSSAMYSSPPGTRFYWDSVSGGNMFGAAIPPTVDFAYFRNSVYNPMYYDTMTTYKPWEPAFVGGALVTYPNQSPSAAQANPAFPTTTATMNLTANTGVITTANRTFGIDGGMILRAKSFSGLSGTRVSPASGSWPGTPSVNVLVDSTLPAFDWRSVAYNYYPATFFQIDNTCNAGAGDFCVTGPDGRILKRYEIKAGTASYPSGRTYAAEIQNFANWWSYARRRFLMQNYTMGQVLTQVRGIRGGLVRMGQTTYPQDTGSFRAWNAYISAPYPASTTMYDFDTGVSSTDQRVLNGLIYRSSPVGGTPIRTGLNYISSQYVTDSTKIQHACQVNSAIVVTDGYSNDSALNPGTYSTSYPTAAPFTPIATGSLAHIASYYYNNNPRPSLTPLGLVPIDSASTSPSTDKNTNLHVNTYAMGINTLGQIFGVNMSQTNDPYNNPPTWPATVTGDKREVDDLFHATINGRGSMFGAANITTAINGLQNVFYGVILKVGSSTSIGLAQMKITASNNIAYAASYNGSYGNLEPYSIDIITGNMSPLGTWSARTLLNARTSANRLIATYNNVGAAPIGVPFQWTNLQTSQKALLNSTISPPGPLDGQFVLNFTRGDRTLEGTSYRTRLHLFGDVTDANPVVVTNMSIGTGFTDPGFTNYSTTAPVTTRATMIYQGANDGMLHAFNAATGAEDWAYIPNLVMGKLRDMSVKTYNHQFSVDGTPALADVAIGGGSSWRTLLVAGLNAGGNGYYALDVTDPIATTEVNVASKVLWEFPNVNSGAAVTANMGNSYGKPVIAKTGAGWVVLVTSGYNNGATTGGDGQGHLFVLNPDTGAVLKDISTGVGSSATPSGLGHLAANFPASTSPLIDYVYGGDLEGNLWRFDLTGSIGSWNVRLLTTLVDPGGIPQPITTAPVLSTISSVRYVYVGTGKLLGTSDLSTTQVQSMYGLVDNATASPLITPLRENLVTQIFDPTNTNITTTVDSTKKGWVFNFPATGERLSVDPSLASGTIVLGTNQPTSNGCQAQSFIYAVDQTTGGSLAASNFTVSSGAGTSQWARKSLSNTFTSAPSVVQLPSGMYKTIFQDDNHNFLTVGVPISVTPALPTVRKVGWKEIQVK